MSTNLTPDLLKSCTARGEQLFLAQHTENAARVDRLFAGLMAVQWLACVAAALWIAPLTWIGAESRIHPHLWAAVFLGGALSLGPVGFTLYRPGAVVTRQVVTIAQMLFSALLIHVTGGRIETHFHIFGSLAFLAFYRERSVLLTATLPPTTRQCTIAPDRARSSIRLCVVLCHDQRGQGHRGTD